MPIPLAIPLAPYVMFSRLLLTIFLFGFPLPGVGLQTDKFLAAVKAELESFDNRRKYPSTTQSSVHLKTINITILRLKTGNEEAKQEDLKRAGAWKLETKKLLSQRAAERSVDTRYFKSGNPPVLTL